MPDWFAALFMLCILSASMSTLSSQFHTMGASVGSDIYGTYKPRSRGKLTNVIRLGVLFSILVSYIICYMLPNDIIARGTSIFMGICAAAFLPAYFCALYWKPRYPAGSDGKPLDRNYRKLICFSLSSSERSGSYGGMQMDFR